jgi:hypothetical protein
MGSQGAPLEMLIRFIVVGFLLNDPFYRSNAMELAANACLCQQK